MNAKTSIKLVLPSIIFLALSTAYAADPAEGGTTVSGEITPKLTYFNYFKGYGADRTQFHEQYNYQKGFGGDRRSDTYLDADLNFVIASPERNIFTLERLGFGPYNHRGSARADADKIGFSASYSNFRSATGGIDYLYGPNQVAGGTDPLYTIPASAYVAQFNDDSNQFNYKIDRTTYGLGIKLKPALLGDVASVSVDFDGYRRKGNMFNQYVVGGSDFTGGAALDRSRQRWRGFDQDINENMNRLSFKLAASPWDQFQLAYDVSFEKFDNQARAFTHGNIPLPAPFVSANPDSPLGFVPDSNLTTHGLRLSKSFGRIAVAAGYGQSRLVQDTFTLPQQTDGYTTGKITTDNAFLNVNANVSSSVGVEGFVKYYKRDNDSSFPVAGFLSATENDELLDVRINSIKSLNYGLAATFRTAMLKSTITAGWKHEDKDRDLTFHQGTVVPPVRGITAERSLYREDTRSDELYLKVISRPMKGVTVRLTPSYLWANKTGLVTEPEKAVGLNAKVSYAAPQGMLVSGFYDYKNKKNANNTLSGNAAGSLVPTGTVTQDTNKKLQAAGVSFSMAPNERINTAVSLSWNQDDFDAYYFGSNRRRFEAPAAALLFATRDRSNYKIDSYVFTVGGDWQASEALRYSGSYTFSHSKGNTASGQILAELTAAAGSVDGRINNSVHTVALGADYALKKNTKLRVSYSYDYYNDKVYSALTGGVNTLMLGLSLGF